MGCAHVPKEQRQEDAPVLPAPFGDIYVRGQAEPRDPLLRSVTRNLPWDEVLSGAATSVALDLLNAREVDPYLLRWKAILAGYPYPITGMAQRMMKRGEVPDDLLDEARRQVGGAYDVGLVRARGHQGDLWVLLIGARRAELGSIPREVESGATLTLTGAQYRVSTPSGTLYEDVDRIVVEEVGEWMVQAYDAQGPIATFPVYVGWTTPELPPIFDVEPEGDPTEDVRMMVNTVRAWYGLTAFEEDGVLDAAARSRLSAWSGGQLPDSKSQFTALGITHGVTAECRSSSVAACIDGLWWSPQYRALFLGDAEGLGIAVTPEGTGVRIVLVAG